MHRNRYTTVAQKYESIFAQSFAIHEQKLSRIIYRVLVLTNDIIRQLPSLKDIKKRSGGRPNSIQYTHHRTEG
jgi:hypothetical protein